MKCAEFDEKLNLLLDEEAGIEETQKLKAHLAACQDCHKEFVWRQNSQRFLRNQPAILPGYAFDNRMLRAFKNYRKTAVPKSGFAFWFNFSNPFLKYGLTAAIFVFGFGLAFLFGRISVSSANDTRASQIEKIEAKQSGKQTPSSTDTTPIDTETKTATKYVEVPVVKEKIVEKKIYVNKMIKPITQPRTESFAGTKITERREKIVEQFNLKDLQPVSTISYKIIRKGENNDE